MAKRLLIIDDSPFMVTMLADILQKEGYEIIGTASNGCEGVQSYQTLQPDMVLLDIVMPEQDGIETLAQIKAHDPQATVVMLSAVSTIASANACLNLGAVGFVAKPFHPEHLFGTLAQASNRKSMPATLSAEQLDLLNQTARDSVLSNASMTRIFDMAYDAQPFDGVLAQVKQEVHIPTAAEAPDNQATLERTNHLLEQLVSGQQTIIELLKSLQK